VTLNKHNPLSLKSWTLLEKKFEALAKKKIVEYFSEDANRTEKFSKQWESFYVDYSKNLLDEETLDLLVSMAEEAGLKEAIAAYFGGAKINETENRAVLHTALRKLNNQPILVDEEDIGPKIEKLKNQMFDFADRVISGSWKGHSGKSIRHIVNIGIGRVRFGACYGNRSVGVLQKSLTDNLCFQRGGRSCGRSHQNS